MRTLKVIIATAVVAFTLTSVAMGAVGHLTQVGPGGAARVASGSQSAAQPQAQAPGRTQATITLTESQFQRMLRAMDRDRARTTERATQASGAANGASTAAAHGDPGDAGTQSAGQGSGTQSRDRTQCADNDGHGGGTCDGSGHDDGDHGSGDSRGCGE
jgi:hypothetical protein